MSRDDKAGRSPERGRRLRSEGGVVAFLRARGHAIPSPALFGQITDAFKTGVRAWAARQGIPWLEFQKGERKDEVVQHYRDRFRSTHGVVCVGVAQERAQAWTATTQVRGHHLHCAYRWKTVCVNHYYVYFVDWEWGPGFLKVCGYVPYTMKLCLNGHEWAKRQLTRRRVAFTPLDNGFQACPRPAVLQEICETLSAADGQAVFDRWVARLPLPVTVADHAAGFGYRLSLLQVEVSRPQVFDRPLRGREFFEEVLRDQLDLGRPSRMQLLFDRKITRATPGAPPDPHYHRWGRPESSRRVQALPHQAVLQGGARPAHRDHLQRHLRLRGEKGSE